MFEVYLVHPDGACAAQAAQAAFDPGGPPRARARPLRAEQRHLARQPPGGGRVLGHDVHDRVPRNRIHVRPDRRRVRYLDRHGLPSLELNPDDYIVSAAKAGVEVDLGGVGKGYAVDLMAELLEEWGVQVALVHGGFSSVLALEPPAGGGWPLTLSDPAAPVAGSEPALCPPDGAGASGVQEGPYPRSAHRRTGARTARCLGGTAAAVIQLPGGRRAQSCRNRGGGCRSLRSC